jgi:hypothetical protein
MNNHRGSLRRVAAAGFAVGVAAIISAATGIVLTSAAAAAVVPATTSSPASRMNAARLDHALWSKVGRPVRLILIRSTSVDLVDRGILVDHQVSAVGTATIPWLVRELGGNRWITMPTQQTAVLSAAVLLGSGTDLQIGPGVRRLLLAGGPAATSAAWIRGSRAELSFTGVTVGSVRAGGADSQPVPASWAGRPYVYMGAGGRLDVAGSTFEDLGRPRRPRWATIGVAGVTWGTNSQGSVTGGRFEGNDVGLLLSKSVGVRLAQVTVEHSVFDGLVLSGDRATVMNGVDSRSNGGSGIAVAGQGVRRITSVSAMGNTAWGLTAVNQTGLILTSVQTGGNLRDGVRLVGCVRCTVTGLVAAGNHRAALIISGASQAVTVTGAQLTGGQVGIAVLAGARAITLRNDVATDFSRFGIEVSAADVRILAAHVHRSQVGIRVYGPASGIVLAGVTVDGGRNGVTVARTPTAVSLSDVTITGVADKGVVSGSNGLRMTGGQISGGQTGIALLAPATLAGLDIDNVATGIHVGSGLAASATRVDVLAERVGIKTAAGSRLDLIDCQVRAPVALAGTGSVTRDSLTVLSLPPLPWLGFAAIGVVLVALILQTVHHLRRRSVVMPRTAARVRDTA